MIEAESALKIILKAAQTLDTERVGLPNCVDRVLAENLRASCDLPPFDNSAMDGFAVRAQDLSAATQQGPVFLRLSGMAKAGESVRPPLKPGSAFKVMTGAPLPRGADSVVMREFAEESDGLIKISVLTVPGENVRRRGEDVRRGEVLLRAGTLLRPYEVSLLAAQGLGRVLVVRRPKVAILASGDELVDWRHPLKPACIRNSSSPALEAALKRWGYEAVSCGIVPDDRERMRRALLKAQRAADVILVTGGVSIGDFDYTRGVLEYLGFKALFWRVAIKPGKPLLFGTWRNRLIFGLPGNPLSTLVCAEEFVRPALERLAGKAGDPTAYPLRGVMVKSFPKPKDRLQYVFCMARQEGRRYLLEAVRPQGSAMVGAASKANALAMAPLGLSRLDIGSEVPFRWLH